MNNTLSLAAFAAATVFCTPVSADTPPSEAPTQESSVRLPSVAAAVSYHSKKIERGMVEIGESVWNCEAEVEWYGVFGGIEVCNDLSDVNRRLGRYNEIKSFMGYGWAFGDFAAKAAYAYKKCAQEESDTQEVGLEFEYELPWFTPFLEFEIDSHAKPGATYGVLGLEREWELSGWAAVAIHGGVGFGNAYRNDADFGDDSYLFRDMNLGTAVEFEVCPHVKLVPGVDFYDFFTSRQRHAYDRHNGFAAVASCSIAVDF